MKYMEQMYYFRQKVFDLSRFEWMIFCFKKLTKALKDLLEYKKAPYHLEKS